MDQLEVYQDGPYWNLISNAFGSETVDSKVKMIKPLIPLDTVLFPKALLRLAPFCHLCFLACLSSVPKGKATSTEQGLGI